MKYTIPTDSFVETIPLAETISIIIPCYNVASCVSRCLDSVIMQTCGLEHLDVVCVDDHSTDDTLDILKDYAKKFPNTIRVIACSENARQGTARNIGMSYARGSYILFIDSDDFVHPDMIRLLYDRAVRSNAEITECEYKIVTPEQLPSLSDELQSIPSYPADILRKAENDDEHRILFLSNSMLTGCVRRLYRTDFIKDNNLYFLERVPMEDIYFSWLALASCTSIYSVPLPLYYYLQTSGGTMFESARTDNYMYVHHVSVAAMDELYDRGLWDKFRNECAYAWFKRIHDLYLFMTMLPEFPTDNYEVIRSFRDTVFPDLMENPYMSDEDRAALAAMPSR